MIKPKNRFARGALYLVAGISAALILFLLTAWIGSSIPRGPERPEAIAQPVTILVETNGAHTQFVLPVSNGQKDWRETFPSANQWVGDTIPQPATHIAIGYGEREVFLNTPTVYDINIATAARVLVSGGEGLIRVTNLINPPLGRNRREMQITPEEYADLVAAIEADLPPLEGGVYRDFEDGTYDDGAYYAALPAYTVSFTCNQWTSDRLADAGIRTGWWTPFSGGVMKWLPPHSTELGRE